VKTFHTLCKVDKREQLSSDHFRMYQLDRFFRDKAHGIGGFFAKMLLQKLVRIVGRTSSRLDSNNSREIKIYEWTEEIDSWLTKVR